VGISELNIYLISDFMNVGPMGAKFYAGVRTDMKELIVAFCNFMN
jgi:hypothetical protein